MTFRPYLYYLGKTMWAYADLSDPSNMIDMGRILPLHVSIPMGKLQWRPMGLPSWWYFSSGGVWDMEMAVL